MLNIIIGLISLMLANIILGLSISIFDKEFDIKVLFNGLLKAIFISIGLILIYYAGYLNPEIIVVNINNVNLSIIESIKYIFVMGIVYYGYEDLSKVIEILKIKVNIKKYEEDGGSIDEVIIPR